MGLWEEMLTRLANLVRQRFHGSYQAAFDHYSNHNGLSSLDADGLKRMLSDANVGNWATRGQYVRGILERVDSDRDAFISWREFKQGFGLN